MVVVAGVSKEAALTCEAREQGEAAGGGGGWCKQGGGVDMRGTPLYVASVYGCDAAWTCGVTLLYVASVYGCEARCYTRGECVRVRGGGDGGARRCMRQV